MDYKEIIKLLDAGYSREDILQMQEDSGADEGAAAGAGTEAGTGADNGAAAGADNGAAAGAAAGANELNAAIKDMQEMFKDFTKEITAMNIMNSQRGADNENTVEDIIANIISPKRKEEGR